MKGNAATRITATAIALLINALDACSAGTRYGMCSEASHVVNTHAMDDALESPKALQNFGVHFYDSLRNLHSPRSLQLKERRGPCRGGMAPSARMTTEERSGNAQLRCPVTQKLCGAGRRSPSKQRNTNKAEKESYNCNRTQIALRRAAMSLWGVR